MTAAGRIRAAVPATRAAVNELPAPRAGDVMLPALGVDPAGGREDLPVGVGFAAGEDHGPTIRSLRSEIVAGIISPASRSRLGCGWPSDLFTRHGVDLFVALDAPVEKKREPDSARLILHPAPGPVHEPLDCLPPCRRSIGCCYFDRWRLPSGHPMFCRICCDAHWGRR